ncbi:MAG: hypothetical protein ACQESB_02585 [Elusimicrobiota bacterium]
MPGIDICGITNKEDAKWAAIYGVEYLSVCMEPGSPKKVSPDSAVEIRRSLPSYTKFALDFGEAENIDYRLIQKVSPDIIKFCLPSGSGREEKVLSELEELVPETVLKVEGTDELLNNDRDFNLLWQLKIDQNREEDLKRLKQNMDPEKLIIHGEMELDLLKKICSIIEPRAWCLEKIISSSARRIDNGLMKKYIREISLI